MGRVLGKVDGGLAGGICRTDDCDLASAVGSRFGGGRAVVDAGADQPFDSGRVQPAVARASPSPTEIPLEERADDIRFSVCDRCARSLQGRSYGRQSWSGGGC